MCRRISVLYSIWLSVKYIFCNTLFMRHLIVYFFVWFFVVVVDVWSIKSNHYTIGLVFCTLVANVKFVFAFFFVAHILQKGVQWWRNVNDPLFDNSFLFLNLSVMICHIRIMIPTLNWPSLHGLFCWTFKLKSKIRNWSILSSINV